MTGFLKNQPRRFEGNGYAARRCQPGVRCGCPSSYATCMTLTTLRSVVVTTDALSWDNSGLVKLGSAEESELRQFELPSRVFNINEPSAGFRLRSHKTGVEHDFRLTDVATSEGDVLYWTFKALTKNLNVTVVIYND